MNNAKSYYKVLKVEDKACYIETKKGHIIIIDEEDMYLLKEYTSWAVGADGYAVVGRALPSDYGSARETCYLARVVLKQKLQKRIDHINRNRFDNRKSNLRLCTHQQNNFNVGPKGNLTGLKGVVLHKKTNRIYARIQKDGVQYHIGSFKTPKEAALAYDKRARELFGEFAYLNFPEEIKK